MRTVLIILVISLFTFSVSNYRKLKECERKNDIQMRRIDSLQNVLVGADFLIKEYQIKENTKTIQRDLDTIKKMLK